MKKLYNKFALPYFKIAKKNLVVYENGQVFIDCDIENVIKEAVKINMPYEIIKGEMPLIVETKEETKKIKK